MRSTAMLLLAAALFAGAGDAFAARVDRSRALTFEASGTAAPFSEWNGQPSGPEGTMFLDSTVVHEGRYSGRLERTGSSPATFSSFALTQPVDFGGDTLELRGWLRLENVEGSAGLWMRIDGKGGMLQFDNMGQRNLRGTAGWTEYRVALPLGVKARKITVGSLLSGAGRVWADDLRLIVDGKPIADAPAFEPVRTVLETDHEFDGGSKIDLTSLTPVQAENLALLGKVWGFLKYHHPAVVAGKRHWDYELFRVMPRVLAAGKREEACATFSQWISSLGEVAPCTSCVELPKERALAPRLGWLSDHAQLGRVLSAQLATIYARRPKVSEQFYVSQAPYVGNPDFSVELNYPDLKTPDAGFRLLALFRFWNMVEYWFPYRDVMEENWDATLREFVPRLAAASTRDEYATAMIALIARVHDTHANLWSSLDVQPPRGRFFLPVAVRFIEGQAVIAGWTNPRLGLASGLRIGDAIRSLDGVPIDTLVARRRPLYAASNEPTRLRDIARNLTRGDSGTVRLALAREGARLELEVARVRADSLDRQVEWRHDHAGPAFRRLSDDVAYLKLSAVKDVEVGDYVKGAAGAKCLVIDIRNYPSAFMVFALGQHLVKEPTPFTRFTIGDLSNPGSFQMGEPLAIQPAAPYFEGGVAILVDEVTQSQAEYTTMALRTHPGTVVVGSTTAGADGNVSPIPLPGGLRSLFSGIGVFYPDGRPTQRIGILPDLAVRPTIVGIRAGRDELFESAVQRVLGRGVTPAEYAALRADEEPAP